MQEIVKAIKNHESDNVATLFGTADKGIVVTVMDKKGDQVELPVTAAIPYGHKLALRRIEIGEQVTKYGEEIGIATKVIEPGDHVHIHNIDSIRGRGDWSE